MNSLEIIQASNTLDTALLAKEVYKVLNQKCSLSAEVIIVDKQEIKRLNSTLRGIDRVTDVLSFPTLENVRGIVINKKDFPLDVVDGKVFLGSIAICLEKAEEQAKEYGHSIKREVLYLLCHGLLHLFGYDHEIESDKIKMRELEEKIMQNSGVKRC